MIYVSDFVLVPCYFDGCSFVYYNLKSGSVILPALFFYSQDCFGYSSWLSIFIFTEQIWGIIIGEDCGLEYTGTSKFEVRRESNEMDAGTWVTDQDSRLNSKKWLPC